MSVKTFLDRTLPKGIPPFECAPGTQCNSYLEDEFCARERLGFIDYHVVACIARDIALYGAFLEAAAQDEAWLETWYAEKTLGELVRYCWRRSPDNQDVFADPSVIKRTTDLYRRVINNLVVLPYFHAYSTCDVAEPILEIILGYSASGSLQEVKGVIQEANAIFAKRGVSNSLVKSANVLSRMSDPLIWTIGQTAEKLFLNGLSNEGIELLECVKSRGTPGLPQNAYAISMRQLVDHLIEQHRVDDVIAVLEKHARPLGLDGYLGMLSCYPNNYSLGGWADKATVDLRLAVERHLESYLLAGKVSSVDQLIKYVVEILKKDQYGLTKEASVFLSKVVDTYFKMGKAKEAIALLDQVFINMSCNTRIGTWREMRGFWIKTVIPYALTRNLDAVLDVTAKIVEQWHGTSAYHISETLHLLTQDEVIKTDLPLCIAIIERMPDVGIKHFYLARLAHELIAQKGDPDMVRFLAKKLPVFSVKRREIIQELGGLRSRLDVLALLP